MDKSATDKKEAKNDKESDSAAAQELVIRVAIIIVASPVRNF